MTATPLTRIVCRDPERAFLAQIAGGVLRLEIGREEVPIENALDFATRHNPERRFLFVSKLLGRHIPTPPRVLREVACVLAQKLAAAQLAQPCLFIGMAETATTLGQAVYREWRRLGGAGLYLDTTRRRTGGEIAFAFTEAHSHAPEHLVYRPQTEDDPERVFERAASLVVIDDELTTGRTVAALTQAYSAFRRQTVVAHVATLVRWHGDEASSSAFVCHSLIEGRFTFAPDANFTPKPLALASSLASVLAPRGTRHGVSAPQISSWAAEAPGHILVVGTGEFGFVPFLLAEQIEAIGGEAFVQATTRSPVAIGGAIVHARCFPALSGEGHDEFLYNVPDDHPYERVILCCEDRLPPGGHPILELPRIECRLAYE